MSLLKPVSNEERNLDGFDFFLLWAGAAISLGEIWAGGLLLPLGLGVGLIAILIGHLIGNTPMALSGIIGSRHGVPSIVSTRGALGNRGAYLPAALNIVQLIGWTGVMLYVAGHAAGRLLAVGALNTRLWTIIIGVLTTVWALGGHNLWKPLQRIAVTLLILLSFVMTWSILREYGFRSLLHIKPTGQGLRFPLGVDLVIAMPVSWIPLVADYSRYGLNSRRSAWGTWLGYFIGSSWMYAIGLAAALATGSDAPDTMVMEVMKSHGAVLSALLIVLLATFTTTFLDIYSNAVSVQSLAPKWSEKWLVVAGGVFGTIIGVVFPPEAYQDFLLFIGSTFCSLFGVVLCDYFLLKRGAYDAENLFRRAKYWYTGGVNAAALGSWLAGFLIYVLCTRTGWIGGSSLPSMIGAALTYYVAMKLFGTNMKEPAQNA